MMCKIINFSKSEKVENVLNLCNCRHEEVIDCTPSDLFLFCLSLFNYGMDVSVIKQQNGNILLRVSQSGFSPSSVDPNRGVKTGKTNKRVYTRKDGETYTPEQVLSLVKERSFKDKKADMKVDFNGDMMNVSSMRLLTFKELGCKCVSCGLEGTVFVKERQGEELNWHFNLYGHRDGEEVLFTRL